MTNRIGLDVLATGVLSLLSVYGFLPCLYTPTFPLSKTSCFHCLIRCVCGFLREDTSLIRGPLSLRKVHVRSVLLEAYSYDLWGCLLGERRGDVKYLWDLLCSFRRFGAIGCAEGICWLF